MSASEVDQPRLIRTAPLASSGPAPMASKTCEGCTLPEEQAEPEETATPARSKPITAVSAFSPGTVNSVVFGRRGTVSEKMIAPGCLAQPAFQPVSQAFEASGLLHQAAHGSRYRRSEPGNSRYVLGSRPASPLLTTAAQQRLKPRQALGQHQRTDALGATDLVRRKRHQISIQYIDIKRYFSERLNRVDVQKTARFVDDLGHLGDRLHGAGFVVGQHDRDQRGRPVFEGRAQAGRDPPSPSV